MTLLIRQLSSPVEQRNTEPPAQGVPRLLGFFLSIIPAHLKKALKESYTVEDYASIKIITCKRSSRLRRRTVYQLLLLDRCGNRVGICQECLFRLLLWIASSDMTSEGVWEIFDGNSADIMPENFR